MEDAHLPGCSVAPKARLGADLGCLPLLLSPTSHPVVPPVLPSDYYRGRLVVVLELTAPGERQEFSGVGAMGEK